ncbi:MAG: aminotransferase class IV [Alphaproteobacteria bacterium]|jgi:branched-subunit amino acid aminotransferase/4-amino-4-deoxychorismate lyase|nr:aminotransferase class IV [Alphaproteobacteria bacterium]MBU2042262.1 aminotransferase class IV [Alphaproteobacteria bacterium]MBU2126061.1 aminotransferase class IV [Alphaproteobacteria bacterium]MBU2209287.1 aminotransferase class IV [Alphaproteobacteria bacterium]MBU2291933.1 aminotransferase class IV [Alphaproteobacteria bacterium]
MAVAHDLRVDGEPASLADLTHQVLFNYGAYTSFRVEVGGVRGLDLHLARLDASAEELFGEAVGETRLRLLMRDAIGAREHCWLRVSLFAPEIWMREPTWRGRPKVMIGAFDPPPPLADSPRVQVQTYAREAAHLKHAATFGLMRARRAAREAGFDDALFADEQGRVSEGSLWNIGFVSGDDVIWPRAPMLAGVAQALVQAGLGGVGLTGRAEPVHVDDLPRFDGAFLCNSATPASAIAAIGEHGFPTAPALIERLRAAWASNPVQPI